MCLANLNLLACVAFSLQKKFPPFRRRMASSSQSRGGSGSAASRLKNVASTFCTDSQPLIADIRKTVLMMKDIAVQLEKDNLPDKAKELEDAVIELVGLSELSVQFSSAVQAFANTYQPREEFTNFNKLFEDELSRFKAYYQSSDVPKNPLVRQFKEAVWNVHHAGQPMPGEEQEDIVMTSTQSNILNITCPLSGKPVTELAEPVRSMECRHIYEKKIIMQYLKSKQHRDQCPISGCPKILQADKLVQDPLLMIEIEEMRKMNRETDVEDYTMLNED